MARGRPRPWRAVATLPTPPGFPAIVVARTSATTREGLDAFVDQHETAGNRLKVWEVLPLPPPPIEE